MKKHESTIIKVLMIIIVVVVVGVIRGQADNPTDQATATTTRNAFISSCKASTADYTTLKDTYCGCAYDRLLAMYPDLATNSARANRIAKEGLTSAETDNLVSCAK